MNASSPSYDPWGVFDYEVNMFRSLCGLLSRGNTQYQSLPHHVRNAIVESAVLHTRILVDILLSRGSQPDDINLSSLEPSFSCPEIDQLLQAYGNRNQRRSACWTFNKMLAHATAERTDSFDYSHLLNYLAPLIDHIVDQLNAQRTPAVFDSER